LTFDTEAQAERGLEVLDAVGKDLAVHSTILRNFTEEAGSRRLHQPNPVPHFESRR